MRKPGYATQAEILAEFKKSPGNSMTEEKLRAILYQHLKRHLTSYVKFPFMRGMPAVMSHEPPVHVEPSPYFVLYYDLSRLRKRPRGRALEASHCSPTPSTSSYCRRIDGPQKAR